MNHMRNRYTHTKKKKKHATWCVNLKNDTTFQDDIPLAKLSLAQETLGSAQNLPPGGIGHGNMLPNNYSI